MLKKISSYLILLSLTLSVFANDSVIDEVEDKSYAKGSVEIDATPEQVWKYLADDNNAQKWSVFFYSITPCPIAECTANETKSAGDIGFIRRSHRNNDKLGIRWDEETIQIIKNKKFLYKAIRAFDFVGYGDYSKKSENLVEQVFQRTEENKTILTFRTSMYEFENLAVNKDDDSENDIGSLTYKTVQYTFDYISKPRASLMFQKNLENIKAAVELGEEYKRVHPYGKFCDVDKWYCPKFIQDF